MELNPATSATTACRVENDRLPTTSASTLRGWRGGAVARPFGGWEYVNRDGEVRLGRICDGVWNVLGPSAIAPAPRSGIGFLSLSAEVTREVDAMIEKGDGEWTGPCSP
jgi:hypothetical protein